MKVTNTAKGIQEAIDGAIEGIVQLAYITNAKRTGDSDPAADAAWREIMTQLGRARALAVAGVEVSALPEEVPSDDGTAHVKEIARQNARRIAAAVAKRGGAK